MIIAGNVVVTTVFDRAGATVVVGTGKPLAASTGRLDVVGAIVASDAWP